MIKNFATNVLISLIFLSVPFTVPSNSIAFSNSSSGKSATVDILVKGDDAAREVVKNTIARTLDLLPRTQVVKENGEWELSVAVTALKIADTNQIGYTISTVIIKRLSIYDLKLILGCDSTSAKSESVPMYVGHWQFSGGPNSLRPLCEKIVADFDTTYLQKWR